MGNNFVQNGNGNVINYKTNTKTSKSTSVNVSVVIGIVVVAVIVICGVFLMKGKSFSIEGKWKNIGSTGIGQAQPGSIIVFDDTKCNFYSPQDTYEFGKDGDSYYLNVTTYLVRENHSYSVKIVDKNQIEVSSKSVTITLKRVQ